MAGKSFSVLIVPHDHRGAMRRVSMTRRFFAGSVSIVVLLFAAALAVPSFLARTGTPYLPPERVTSLPEPAPQPVSAAYDPKQEKLLQENQELRAEVYRLARSVETLARSLEEYEAPRGGAAERAATAAGGVPDDGSLDFENPEFFEGNPVDLARTEMEKAEYWTRMAVDRVQERKMLDSSTPSIYPVPGGLPTYGFRWRTDPFTGKPAFHRGIDFAARRGTPVYATASGVVTFAGWQGGYGKTLEISHNEYLKTRYAHMDRFLVRKGDSVRKGQQIGEVGSSGRSTGPHLHYEVLEYGVARKPDPYLVDERSDLARR